jgi:dTDP-4-amino-4,6-dideoxygalactose transaminase
LWEFNHDVIAYNYRLTNLAGALGCGQIENLEFFVAEKRNLAAKYESFFANEPHMAFVKEPLHSRSNYWLQAIILPGRTARDAFLEYTNQNGVMTRPIWTLMNKLEMYKNCQTGDLSNALWLEDRVVNIPSSVFVRNYYHHDL